MGDSNEFERTIRAIVQSSKIPLTVNDIQKDWYSVESKPIPFKQFGFASLDQFLQSFESLRVSGSGSYARVSAVASTSSKHVTSLINKQKTTGKKSSFAPPAGRGRGRGRGGYHYPGPPRNSYQKPEPYRNNSPDEPPRHSTARPQKYPSTETRRYPAEPYNRSNSFEPKHNRSNTEESYKRQTSTGESSYHRPSENRDPNSYRSNSPENVQNSNPTQRDFTSNPRRGYHNSSVSNRGGSHGNYVSHRGGSHGNDVPHRGAFHGNNVPYRDNGYQGYEVPPRMKPQRQIHPAENVREPKEQLVVKMYKDNERQVIFGDSSDEGNHMKSLEEKENIPKTKYNVPPSLRKPRLANPHMFPEPAEASSGTDGSDHYPLLRMDMEKPPRPYGPRDHVAIGIAMKNAEWLQGEGRYHERFSVPQAQVETPGALEEILSGISFEEPKIPFQEPILDTIPSVVKETQMFDPEPVLDTIPPHRIPTYPQQAHRHSVPRPDAINIAKNVQLLQAYMVSQGLPEPEYKVNKRRPEGGATVMYTAKVMIIGADHKEKKFSSWPNENARDVMAMGFAALKALEDLKKEEDLSKNMQSTDQSLICERIHEMVADSITGVVSWSIEAQYIKHYNEKLPENWLAIVKNNPKLELDSSPGGCIIQAKEKFVISPMMVKPPPLKFPDPPLDPDKTEMWDVLITRASGPNDVSLLLIGEDYHEKLKALSVAMDAHYKSNVNKQNALVYEKGNYYAAHIADDILRVQVLDVLEDTQEAVVLLVDHGATLSVSFSTLYPLIPDFVQLPCQAIACSLEGLEKFDDEDSKTFIATNTVDLIGKSRVAEIKEKDEINPFVSVVLFDTSHEEADVNVNEKLADALLCRNTTPSLQQANGTMVVTVSSVSPAGEVYIQLPSLALGKVAELTETITEEQLKSGKLTKYNQVILQGLYMARFGQCGWYRAKIIDKSQISGEITVQFVDYGNIDTIGISDLVDITNLPRIYQILPHQALKVELRNLDVKMLNTTDKARLSSLLQDQEVTITIIDPNRNPPLVNMEVYQDGKLTPISIALDSLRSLDNLANIGQSLELMPELEDTDNWQAMSITLCPNPSIFFFQLAKYADELENLMMRMQAFYAIIPVEAANIDVTANQAYACLYPADQAWYRVMVTKVIGDDVFIYLVDFGDTNIVPKSNLRQLVAEFRQSPIMAMKARIGGIRPKNVDWQVEDCTRFHELVSNKPMFGKVLGVERNIQDLSDSKAVLRLLEPAAKKYIEDILMSEGRAIREVM